MRIENIDHNLKLLEKSFGGLADINKYSQTILTPVVRWSPFIKSWLYTLLHPNARLRRQNDAEHTLGMVMLVTNTSLKLQPYNPSLDCFLLTLAATDHEFGEGILKSDVCYLVKKSDRDRDEYLAFVKRFAVLGGDLMIYHRRAFLLQFAGIETGDEDNAWEIFPEADRKILHWLWENRRREAYIFKYCERLEYILFAIEQGCRYRNYIMAEEVLRNHICDMHQACKLIPGWEEKIWTPNIDNLAKEVHKELVSCLPPAKLFKPEINRGV